MLYHVSQKTGLKSLQPHISTHQKAYVYAIENMVTGMLFGTRQDDFDFIISTEDNDVPVLYECYPNAFQNIYQGKSCSVYQVNDEGFQRGVTSWEPELVCESEVEVVNEIFIEDLYQRLLEEEQQGRLIIHRYEFCDEYRKRISSHIVDRLIRFEIDLDGQIAIDRRFSVYYKNLVQELVKVMDGHLLQ